MESHSHKVWQNQTDQRWYTYINDPETGKRKLISRNSKKKMMEFLNKTSIDEFKNSKVPTIRKLYPLWLEHKSLMCADTYIPRVKSDWKRYYENDPIIDVPITSLNKIDLESWVLHLIKDNEMTKTNYYNVSLIIRQIFQFAYDSEIIKENPFDRVKKDLGKLFKKKRSLRMKLRFTAMKKSRSLRSISGKILQKKAGRCTDLRRWLFCSSSTQGCEYLRSAQ